MRLAGLRWKVLLAAVFLVGTGLTGVALVDTRTEPVRARDWANANSHRLPSVMELADYPLAFRRAAFGVMSSAAKSEAASEFLTDFLTRPSLTTEQREFVLEMRKLLTAALYEGVTSSPGHNERFKWVCNRLGLLFPDKEERQLLATFGAGKKDVEAWRNWAASVQRAIGIGVANAGPAVPFCDCIEFTFCSECSGMNNQCRDSPDNENRFCKGQEPGMQGCGCFWMFLCTGDCGMPDPTGGSNSLQQKSGGKK